MPLEIKDRQGWLLAQKCMEGDLESHQELRKRITQVLRPYLLQRGATQTEANDIVADLASDCVANLRGGGSLLRKYGGKGTLDGWLLKTALNRFLSLRRTQKFENSFLANGSKGNPISETFTLAANESPEDAVLSLIRNSLLRAFSRCSAEERLMLRLLYCEGVTQRELGKMWRWPECKVSRRLSRAVDWIKSETLRQIALEDPSVSIIWEDFLALGDTLRLDLVWKPRE